MGHFLAVPAPAHHRIVRTQRWIHSKPRASSLVASECIRLDQCSCRLFCSLDASHGALIQAGLGAGQRANRNAA